MAFAGHSDNNLLYLVVYCRIRKKISDEAGLNEVKWRREDTLAF